MPEISVNIFEPLLLVNTLWKDHVKVEIETEDQHECTQCEYKYTNKKKFKKKTYAWKSKKSIRRTIKIRSSNGMSVNINVLNKKHKNHKEKTDVKLKTEET